MAPSKGFTGRGTVCSIGVAGNPENFTPIAQLKTAIFNGQKINFDDISNLDSPLVNATVLKEQMPATAEAGTVQLAGIFLPLDAGQQALDAAYGSADPVDFKIQLPKGPGQATGNLYTFSGYLTDQPLPDNLAYDKALTFKCNIQLTTLITKTLGQPPA